MSEPSLTAEVFAAAVERLTAHRGRPIVVKLGGSAMEDPAATDACLRSVVTLFRFGVEVVLVHGGGKPIDRAMAETGLTPRKVAGRRYTDDDTLKIVVRVLQEIGHDLADRLTKWGCPATVTPDALLGERLVLPGADGKPIDLGRVGTPTDLAHSPIGRAGTPYDYVQVIPSIARDTEGQWLNVNADTAASFVAGALKADKAVFLTDTPGVLRDRANPKSLIPQLTERECRDLIASGVIDGGMVPKVEACFEALDACAKSALILDGRVPYSLLNVFLHDTFTGTVITR
ncbi:acetylglutamate kinase : Acetylglutamate kinase OS=Singulisphaera acidiphila (strain ATCC BAA-1392 / DSM 18658 / VKM B-2454 / MOB10) GN=argB PE=3 SV=1: AA_kinase [Gemmata massiliana]|uniref:Acetylglutamate kinase n=1 Tax=Gemmata massiliana TaxID=1210884 RepID=A0A6P2D4V9_9BACT|nr:acetylglutamate kinase [Gemmata massiliana]VTR95526.1 acetylglutamate kinase : Acetylglutamate kinase OS=Singulisphaera acidiphila (strain ATCC BAA-1392 / DSM 18658 / VKM B-2454 / MOB10) GN=argB PE=3 SV=1: AA_kinase [Gemmata massiliana]